MSRNLTFRAKSKITNQFVFGFYEYDNHLHEHLIRLNGFVQEVDEKTVGQFTGVTDFEGNDIFEGDILEVLSIEANDGNHVFKKLELYYDEELCAFQFRGDWEPFNAQFGNDFRVLGNIFDNPELINEAGITAR